jgi:hypothetical protein
MSKECEYIHGLFNSIEKNMFPFDKNKIPGNGIYILFENGELAHSANRIVRIGTHTGDNNLPKRLKEHFINENKDRSIFRKNIGLALLNRDNDEYIDKWNLDLTTKEAKHKYSSIIDMNKQEITEKRVTEYIQNNFSFIVLNIENKQTRLTLESKIISTISLCDECKQSEFWLGNYSTKYKIKESGLWLSNELYKIPLNENDIKYLDSIMC